MKTDVEMHRRRSIRLREYDYAQPGAYFITIVAHARAMVFGEISDGDTRLNNSGLLWNRCGLICQGIISTRNAMRL
jgi:hypothetical protein